MIFRRKQELVDAVVFHEGSEDGWIVYFSGNMFNYEETFDTKEHAKKFVELNSGYHMLEEEDKSFECCYEEPVAYIDIRGKEHRIFEGYYIVTRADKSKSVMSPKDFRDTYEFAGIDAVCKAKLREIYKEEQ
jgi:hypothetical protein